MKSNQTKSQLIQIHLMITTTTTSFQIISQQRSRTSRNPHIYNISKTRLSLKKERHEKNGTFTFQRAAAGKWRLKLSVTHGNNKMCLEEKRDFFRV